MHKYIYASAIIMKKYVAIKTANKSNLMIYNDLLGSRKHATRSLSCPSIANLITLSLSKLNPAMIPPQNCKTFQKSRNRIKVLMHKIKSYFNRILSNLIEK